MADDFTSEFDDKEYEREESIKSDYSDQELKSNWDNIHPDKTKNEVSLSRLDYSINRNPLE